MEKIKGYPTDQPPYVSYFYLRMESESSSDTALFNQREKNKIRVRLSSPQNFSIAFSLCYNTVLSGIEQWMGFGRWRS